MESSQPKPDKESGQVRALLIHPRFNARSFWSYQEVCAVTGTKSTGTPLGLITMAALLPREWSLRLVDLNAEELVEDDLKWADIIMTGGMLAQQRDILRLLSLAEEHCKPVVVGGPDVAASPHIYRQADFKVIGEAEELMEQFVEAWMNGAMGGEFVAKRYPDIKDSPVPRFDLLKFENYLHVGIQLSRGCPFACEFCNVIELNGRIPRFKSSTQMINEMEALYSAGYRGHVDLVDDNLIGDRQTVKALLKDLAIWVSKRRFPFRFSIEASINLADDNELLQLMKAANFFTVFVGIESPDNEILRRTKKHQNTRRDISESIRKIHASGMFVTAGFIIGFDGEQTRVAKSMIACIEDANISLSMVGLLFALPGTELFHRLEREGRLFMDAGRVLEEDDADQCTSGINFISLRPRREILEDYRTVLAEIYKPDMFFERVRRQCRDLRVGVHQIWQSFPVFMRDLKAFCRITWKYGVCDHETRGPFWNAAIDCLTYNPKGFGAFFCLAALYLHVRPFSIKLDSHIANRIAREDDIERGRSWIVRRPKGEGC